MPAPTDAPRLESELRTDEYYDKRWSQEDEATTPPNKERVGLVVQAAVTLLKGHARPRILDIGCGNGWILAALSDAVGDRVQLYGLEPSEVGVRNSQRRVPGAKIYHGLLGQVAFDTSFDLIVCSEVIEHVEDQAFFMGQLRSLLNANGALVLTTPNARFRDRYFTSPQSKAIPQPVEQWLTRDQLLELAEPHFTHSEVRTFDSDFAASNQPFLRFLRHRIVQLRGGWHIWRHLDRFLCARGHGLYHIMTAQAR